jgi:hypothetical protein
MRQCLYPARKLTAEIKPISLFAHLKSGGVRIPFSPQDRNQGPIENHRNASATLLQLGSARSVALGSSFSLPQIPGAGFDITPTAAGAGAGNHTIHGRNALLL